jgi:hypothetical protein
MSGPRQNRARAYGRSNLRQVGWSGDVLVPGKQNRRICSRAIRTCLPAGGRRRSGAEVGTGRGAPVARRFSTTMAGHVRRKANAVLSTALRRFALSGMIAPKQLCGMSASRPALGLTRKRSRGSVFPAFGFSSDSLTARQCQAFERHTRAWGRREPIRTNWT